MQPDEAFLSFYFGRDASFVWAVGKTGPVAFAAMPRAPATSITRCRSCARRSSPTRR